MTGGSTSAGLAAFVAGLLAAAPGQAQQRLLTLREALATAGAHHPQLTQARANVIAAQTRADQARSALLPQVAGTAAYSRQTANAVAAAGPGPAMTPAPTFDTYGYWSFGLSASQLLWDFGQTAGRWKAARAATEAQQGTAQATWADLAFGVKGAFFTARASRALVTVAREASANQEKHVTQVRGYVEAGVRPDIDLVQARMDAANAQVQLINAENGYEVAKARLNQAVGVAGPTDYDVTDEAAPAVSGEEGLLQPLLDEALAARPELTAFTAQVRSQELGARAAEGGYWPALGVSTRFTDVGPQVDHLGWNWNAAMTLTWPLFQGLLTQAQVREARAGLLAAQAGLERERQQVLLEVQEARLAVRAAVASLGAADSALANARERLRLAEGRYTGGLGTIIELGDAQIALTAAGAQRVQADYTLASARAQLQRALGRP